MKYTGRLATFFMVLIVNMIYITYYFITDGFVSRIEYIGLPIILILAWHFGKLYDVAKYFSEKDTLTGIYNRRYAEALVAKLMQKSQNFTLLLLDVNDFKMVNDLYGHKTGDQYLMMIAAQLKQSVHKKDLVARWGGDEFLIISPNAHNNSGIAEIKNRIDRNLKAMSTKEIAISVSIGTAAYPRDGKTFDELLKISDKNMYRNKSLKNERTNV